jgi:RimJ/RimL family protein N-acetyltransferase
VFNSLRRLRPARSTAALDRVAHESFTSTPVKIALSSYDVLYAPLIATWARGARELEWLAPATEPPLTASKVHAWGRSGGDRCLYWHGEPWEPLGYTELNPMPDRPRDFWIGHFVIAPEARGTGRGRLFFQSSLCRAFCQLGAREVLLIVSPDNVAAIHCYEGCGMTPAGRETKYFRNRRRRYEFVRMTMSLARFKRWSAEGRIKRDPAPYVAEPALLRQGTLARNQALAPV